jgi:hypothetical protein
MIIKKLAVILLLIAVEFRTRSTRLTLAAVMEQLSRNFNFEVWNNSNRPTHRTESKKSFFGGMTFGSSLGGTFLLLFVN